MCMKLCWNCVTNTINFILSPTLFITHIITTSKIRHNLFSIYFKKTAPPFVFHFLYFILGLFDDPENKKKFSLHIIIMKMINDFLSSHIISGSISSIKFRIDRNSISSPSLTFLSISVSCPRYHSVNTPTL